VPDSKNAESPRRNSFSPGSVFRSPLGTSVLPQIRRNAFRNCLVVLGFAFPDHHYPPAEIAQERRVARIPSNIASELMLPGM